MTVSITQILEDELKVKLYLKILAIGLCVTSCGSDNSSLGVDSGTGTTQDESTTVTAYEIQSNDFFTCLLGSSKQLRCWGKNTDGQLGIGTTTAVGANSGDMGTALQTVDLGTGRSVKKFALGRFSTCAILDNDTVKCWGNNGWGQLGLGDYNKRGDQPNQMGDNLVAVNLGTGVVPAKIAMGEATNCIISTIGKVKCWGSNGSGTLGLGDTTYRGGSASDMGDNLPFVDLGTGRTALEIAMGSAHVCVILDNKSVKCWGNNYYGELGMGDTNKRGDGPNEMGDNLPAVDLGTGRTAKALSIKTSSTCAILDNDTLKCWGRNSMGQLGLGDANDRGDNPNEMGDNLPTVDLGTGLRAVSISAGTLLQCAVLNDKSIKCWGLGGVAMGIGSSTNRGDSANQMGDNLPAINLGTGFTLASMTTGQNMNCALSDKNKLKCWGANGYGSLGLENSISLGSNSNEMGDNLPFVDYGSDF